MSETVEERADRHLKSFQDACSWITRIWQAQGWDEKPNLIEIVERAKSDRERIASLEAELSRKTEALIEIERHSENHCALWSVITARAALQPVSQPGEEKE